MIEIDFFYRPKGTNDEPKCGKITVETARQIEGEEDWYARVKISDPVNFDRDLIGVDPLNTLEQAMGFLHSYMIADGYQFWRWEGSKDEIFKFYFPPIPEKEFKDLLE
jgi:hypothetical protein